MTHIGKLLPIDAYVVNEPDNLHASYTQSLTHLYQPLIGIYAVSLYYTLIHDAVFEIEQAFQTHHGLMTSLNLPLDEIYEARLKLEGIGLLKTYKKEEETYSLYTYELLSPLSPNMFFNNLMMSELLYQNIGKTKYKRLENYYLKQAPLFKGKNETALFSDVFQTFGDAQVTQVNYEESDTSFPLETLDFTWIETSLKKQMIPSEKVLSAENKEFISQIVQLYGLEFYEVEKALMWSLTEENELNQKEFEAACKDLFSVKYNEPAPKLVEKAKEISQAELQKKTKEDELVERFEHISPKKLLEDLSSGNNASEQDLKMISEIMQKQGLKMPVMNVLIHYTLIQTNMQLSRAYLEKIASHWSRANLNNAAEAMEFAKQQVKAFKEKKPGRQVENNEVVPDWFKERKKKPVNPTVRKTEKVVELDEEALREKMKKVFE